MKSALSAHCPRVRRTRRWFRALSVFFTDRRGAAYVEYILAMGMVVLLAVAGFRRFSGKQTKMVRTETDEFEAITGDNPFKALAGGSFSSPDVPNPSGGGSSPFPNFPGGFPGGGCFVAGTKVAGPEGPKAIEQVHEGDEVWARDEESGVVGLRRVLGTFITADQPIVRVTVDRVDGEAETLDATPAHLFWSLSRGWIPARDLAAGEELVSLAGQEMMVAAVLSLPDPTTVFNLEVEDLHTYFVGEMPVWVHNGKGGPPPFNPCSANLPPPAPKPPKSPNCTDAEHDAIYNEFKPYCDQPRSCSNQGDTCNSATAKVAAGNACVSGRTVLQQKCYKPGPAGNQDPRYQKHMMAIAEASAGLRNCNNVMMAKCL